jgi:hypothetical protein
MHQRIDERQGSNKYGEQDEEMKPDTANSHAPPLV